VSRREILRRGSERLRVGPWRGATTVAYITPVWESPTPSPDLIRHAMRILAKRGYREVLTGALSAREQLGFLEVGFEVRDHLHLLSHDLEDLPDLADTAAIRRARRRDRAAVLEVDRAAFDSFWRLDEAGLDEALDATPSTRFRVATAPDVVAYVVAGRAGSRGYLQRLAVHPDHQRSGLGAALVLDALHWMRRRGTVRAAVNTQTTNEIALGLYLRLGFQLEPGGLAVLGQSLRAAERSEDRLDSRP